MSGPPMRLSHRQRCGRYLLPAGPSCSWVAWSFGVRDLLGIQQMQAWINGRGLPAPRLKTGRLYRWFRHPMYISVLLGVWATPRMSVGHLLLADSLTTYVLIAMH
jgi:methanethiol S-methyltransferase